MGKVITVVGMDPSMNNWGLAKASLDLSDFSLEALWLSSIHPAKLTGKQVRQNSIDLVVAQQLYADALAFARGAHAVFVEVPHGSQSARAMASYGICVGVLAGLRAHGLPLFELNANEVKLATGLKKDASKKQMIEWAMRKHPEANWPMYTKGGETLVSEAKAEHQADAVAAIHAGLASTTFQQLLPHIKAA